ncbi:MAG TPA: alpha-hydroxy-acid oxidizing protein [Egicoccus sp.]|nr:alpha-hydroxy-acid oxidizing protein [Egicoccus sp.]HSK23085.1 alpha-hydroxy-acid oxidizing protein [Egicoccus sp.]
MGFNTFQYELYFAGLGGKVPDLPVTYAGLEAAARERLDDKAFAYVAGSAGAERTAAANLQAFARWRLVPRMLVDVAERDLEVELFGRTLPAPLLSAPVGVLSIVHEEGEKAVARAMAGLGLPSIHSTVSSFPLEEIAAEAGDGPRWFQLYWPSEDPVTDSLVQRAADAGYEAVVITLDTRLLAWRPRDIATAYLPFLHAEGLANYLTDPVFQAGVAEPNEHMSAQQAAVMRWIGVFSDPGQTWTHLRDFCARSPLPVLVKGIQHPDDAKLAIDAGVAGLVVSNHGGRQVDNAIASLDALPGVVDAVGGEVPVLFDSGVRTGADAAVAIALGARAVLVGRPWVWGLALAGAEGVTHVFRCLLADLDLTMALAGLPSLAALNRGALVDAGSVAG